MPERHCRQCAKKVPWYSLFGNLSLAIYKLVVGWLGGSSALIADGCHSLADVVGSTCILVTYRMSEQPPDEEHQYGHGKAEFVGAVFVYTVLLFFSCAIVFGAIMVMADPEPPHLITLLGAVVSILYNGLMYLYAKCAGDRCNSPALLADAFENKADAISSMACAVGIAAAVWIHPICDPIAALVVGGVIFWNCITQLKSAASGLMDRGLPADEVEDLKRVAAGHAGVLGVRFLQTRQTGPRFWVDVGINVAEGLGVAESDSIAAAVRNDLRRHPKLAHVEVFVVPSRASRITALVPVGSGMEGSLG